MPHDCYEKAKEIERRTKLFLGMNTHNIISTMCANLGFNNSDEFWAWLNKSNDAEVEAQVKLAQQQKQFATKKRKQILQVYA